MRTSNQDELTALDICAEVGWPAGTIHADLVRLHKQGLIVVRRETPCTKRPARYFYSLTATGASAV